MRTSIRSPTVQEAPSSAVSRLTAVLRHRRAALALPLIAALRASRGSTAKPCGN